MKKKKTSEKECRQRYHVIFIIFYHKYMNLMLQFIWYAQMYEFKLLEHI